MSQSSTTVRAGSMYEAFADVVRAAPDAPALVNGSFRMSYRELHAAAGRFAAAMAARGVRHGDRVAILATAGPEVTIAFLGCARLGAIYLGLGTRLSRAELSYVLNDALPTVTIGMRAFRGRDYASDLADASAEAGASLACVFDPDPSGRIASSFERLLASGECARPPHRALVPSGADALALIYTSGSTGAPKGAIIGHAGIQIAAKALLGYWPFERRVLSLMPIDHIAFLLCEMTAVVLGGGTLVQLPFFDPDTVLETIERERVTCWCAITTMLQRVLACERFATTDLSSMELLWWPGPLADSAIAAVRKRVRRVANSYGMTEASGTISFTDPDADDLSLATTVGRPNPYVAVRLREEPGVAADEPREVLLRGPQLMLGYWGKPEVTARSFIDGDWFCTGDLGLMTDGVLSVAGRKKEIIRSGGYNLMPAEIERALEEHPAVQCAYVVGVPHELFGEAVHAIVQLLPGASAAPAELDAHVRTLLAAHKAPKSYALRDDLPLLANGKVDRKSLAAQLRAERENGVRA
jgi:acyl-CoA synthetase (AMP-forming)/AMP-acid ligase II